MHFYIACEHKKNPFSLHVLKSVPYLYAKEDDISVIEVIFIKYMTVITTFVWNYMNALLIIIGVALTTQFKLFNDELKRTKTVSTTGPNEFK